MKNKVIHLSFTEHALGDYYFSLTNHRTCPRTMREVIPMDSCNPVPTWSTFLCDSCSRPVKCHQCMEFWHTLNAATWFICNKKVCVITSLKREISKKNLPSSAWRRIVFQVAWFIQHRVRLLGKMCITWYWIALYMYP